MSDHECPKYVNQLCCLRAEIAALKAENTRMRGLLKSSYGYVKAHEHEGLTKGILAEIEQALNEKEK